WRSTPPSGRAARWPSDPAATKLRPRTPEEKSLPTTDWTSKRYSSHWNGKSSQHRDQADDKTDHHDRSVVLHHAVLNRTDDASEESRQEAETIDQRVNDPAIEEFANRCKRPKRRRNESVTGSVNVK